MRVRTTAIHVLFTLAIALPGTARGQTPPAYAALRGARPAGRGLAVSNLVLERDAFRFRFESGSFQMLAPVEGRAIGAVFSGEGSFELSPASGPEARHFAMLSGDKGPPPFADRFKSAVLLFTDSTSAEIESGGTAGAKSWRLLGAGAPVDRHEADAVEPCQRRGRTDDAGIPAAHTQEPHRV